MKQRDIADAARDAGSKKAETGEDCELGTDDLDKITGGTSAIGQAIKSLGDGLSQMARKG